MAQAVGVSPTGTQYVVVDSDRLSGLVSKFVSEFNCLPSDMFEAREGRLVVYPDWLGSALLLEALTMTKLPEGRVILEDDARRTGRPVKLPELDKPKEGYIR